MIIIGILATIAIPVFLQQRTRAQTAECESDARNGASAATGYAAEYNGSYTGMTEPILSGEPPDGYNWNYGTNSGTPAVAVATGGQSYTITIICASGETVTFDSTSGSVTRT